MSSLPSYIISAFEQLGNPLPDTATEDTLLTDVLLDSLELLELLSELDLDDDDFGNYKTIGDLMYE